MSLDLDLALALTRSLTLTLTPSLMSYTVWNFWMKVPKPLLWVWMFFVVLRRGGRGRGGATDIGKRAEPSARTRHAAPPPPACGVRA